MRNIKAKNTLALPTTDYATRDVRRRLRNTTSGVIVATCLLATGCAPLASNTAPTPPHPASSTPSTSGDTASAKSGLMWSDEFSGPAGAPADPHSWSYENGGSGWGNNELEYYTQGPGNASLDGEGHLAITAQKVPPSSGLQCWNGPCQFTSARLDSAGKQEVEYGRIEFRAKVPGGAGVWPAVWLLGSNIGQAGWPQSGELDMMEFVGKIPDGVFGTIHGPGYSGAQADSGNRDLGEPVADQWHVYSVEWSPALIVWKVDGTEYHRATPADVAPHEWVFDGHPFFLVINLAVGGNFGGDVASDTTFPETLLLDYIRIYQERG
jgi:beta-glucanase (GH16 family)